MDTRLSPHGLGVSFAVLGAIFMVLLSVGSWLGVYAAAAEAMIPWMMWYDTTVVGTVTGVVECGVWGYVSGYALAWIYNKAQI